MKLTLRKFLPDNWDEFVHWQSLEETMKFVANTEIDGVNDNTTIESVEMNSNGDTLTIKYLDKDGKEKSKAIDLYNANFETSPVSSLTYKFKNDQDVNTINQIDYTLKNGETGTIDLVEAFDHLYQDSETKVDIDKKNKEQDDQIKANADKNTAQDQKIQENTEKNTQQDTRIKELEDKPTPKQVQADWNVSDTANMAHIKNKPDVALQSDVSNLQTQIDNIPEQVQSDWNVSDTTSMAYIKNKPQIGGVDLIGSANYLENSSKFLTTDHWAGNYGDTLTVSDGYLIDTHSSNAPYRGVTQTFSLPSDCLGLPFTFSVSAKKDETSVAQTLHLTVHFLNSSGGIVQEVSDTARPVLTTDFKRYHYSGIIPTDKSIVSAKVVAMSNDNNGKLLFIYRYLQFELSDVLSDYKPKVVEPKPIVSETEIEQSNLNQNVSLFKGSIFKIGDNLAQIVLDVQVDDQLTNGVLITLPSSLTMNTGWQYQKGFAYNVKSGQPSTSHIYSLRGNDLTLEDYSTISDGRLSVNITYPL